MKYSIARCKAQLFANERNAKVYIAKTNKQEDYKIEFENRTTPRFSIIETVNPCMICND